MKIAAGCFGCLAVIFLFLAVGWGFIVAMMPTDVQVSLGMVTAYVSPASYGCCCLSALLTVVFLAVGMMGNKGSDIE
jgi:hypothetical protein